LIVPVAWAPGDARVAPPVGPESVIVIVSAGSAALSATVATATVTLVSPGRKVAVPPTGP
jgi:hypothetical protein